MNQSTNSLRPRRSFCLKGPHWKIYFPKICPSRSDLNFFPDEVGPPFSCHAISFIPQIKLSLGFITVLFGGIIPQWVLAVDFDNCRSPKLRWPLLRADRAFSLKPLSALAKAEKKTIQKSLFCSKLALLYSPHSRSSRSSSSMKMLRKAVLPSLYSGFFNSSVMDAFHSSFHEYFFWKDRIWISALAILPKMINKIKTLKIFISAHFFFRSYFPRCRSLKSEIIFLSEII